MPLPQEVINRLSQDRPPEASWSSGMLWFAFGLLAIVALMYAGMAFAYMPYLNNRLNAVSAQLNQGIQGVNTNQVAAVAAEYSQVVHVKSLLQNHVMFSNFLTWLSKRTQPSVYYGSLQYLSNNQIALTVLARNESDINQQMAIFESDPAVAGVTLSNISLASVSGYWQANMTLTVKPSLFSGAGAQ